jgi:hypothetical protein
MQDAVLTPSLLTAILCKRFYRFHGFLIADCHLVPPMLSYSVSRSITLPPASRTYDGSLYTFVLGIHTLRYLGEQQKYQTDKAAVLRTHQASPPGSALKTRSASSCVDEQQTNPRS